MQPGAMKPSESRVLAQVQSDLARLARYDDESVVADHWGRQRYGSGTFAGLGAARAAAVRTAWHEAGHAVAALAVGARFSSASIHYGGAGAPAAGSGAAGSGATGSGATGSGARRPGGRGSAGRVHGVTGAGAESFVVDAAGQIAERLMDWTMLDSDAALRQWLPGWRGDGGDARRFRQAIAARPGRGGWDEVTAWRHSEAVLAPRRLQVREVARALLVAPRHLPCAVVAAIARA
jgi:hypothetical protein